MSETESIEILSDAGEVLASSPLPGEALIEGGEGEVKEFSLAAEVLRDGHAATFPLYAGAVFEHLRARAEMVTLA
jgi:hypothetical protein